jgi:hypothetical protein
MTSSGTYNFNPSIGEITLYAFNLCGVRSSSLAAEHMQSAKTAINMMLSRWSNMGVNLWKVDLVTTALVDGQSTYNVDAKTVMILDAYVAVENGDGSYTDRLIMPVSRTEYASYPNKEQQGFPTIFWFDRLINPTVTLWPVPVDPSVGNPKFLKYYRVIQIEDANMAGGETADIPYRWLDALANGLAYYLARIWQPQMVPQLKAEADEAYAIAAAQDTENVAMYISPMIGGYFR